MLVALSEDQAFFRETTARFLSEQAPPDAVRALRDDATGFEREFWRRGAELGWTSLLVDEQHGGGSISGSGLVDLSLVAYEFGAHAAPGPLVPTNVVAAALGAADTQPEALAAFMAGEAVATWCLPSIGAGPGRFEPGFAVRREGGALIVRGEARPVEAAAQADHILVTAEDSGGLSQLLVPAATPGVSVAPLRTVDLTRRFGAVRLDDVRLGPDALVGEAGGAGAEVAVQFLITLALLNSESVGAMQSGFDMTVEWAFDRYSFGRPLASYQALKHRFADMLSWLEASHAVADAACQAAAVRSPEAEELASAAKAFIGQYGAELLQDCVQLHGGIGVTFEHDLHLYLRRLTVNRAMAGTPSEHRRHITGILDAGWGEAA
jgi:alkylation response protein AidB-like acyl-CoA dehydrogenase